MLAKFKIRFKMEGAYTHNGKTKSTPASSKKGLMVVGLQSLIHTSEATTNVVIKSALRTHRRPATAIESCYLKSCRLCNKELSLDKDVYMYRGDLGFCSIECRDRQIVLDEMRELEASTKQILKSYKRCSTDERRETRLLLEELRQRHKPLPHQNHWTIVS